MSEQPQGIFAEGVQYLRMRDTGRVVPIHVEQLKLIKKEQADIVIFKNGQFEKLNIGAPPPPPEPKMPEVKVVQEALPAGVVIAQPPAFQPPPQPVTEAPAAPVIHPAPPVQPQPVVSAPNIVRSVPAQPQPARVDLNIVPPTE